MKLIDQIIRLVESNPLSGEFNKARQIKFSNKKKMTKIKKRK